MQKIMSRVKNRAHKKYVNDRVTYNVRHFRFLQARKLPKIAAAEAVGREYFAFSFE